MSAALLLPLALAAPVALLLACMSRDRRYAMISWLWLAPLPALAAALLAVDAPALVIDADGLEFTLALDRPGALLLGGAALLWSAAGLYARAYLAGQPNLGAFAVYWLLTLLGSLWVFFAGDLASFYLAFAFASLAAYGLVIHDGTPGVRRAAGLYLTLAILGEVLLLVAFAMLATITPGDTLAIREVTGTLATSPWRGLTLALLIAGFGLKAGLVPLHVWLPIAHPAAPMPASAVLSGAIVKAGIIGLIRFLPLDGVADWATVVTALGFVTAFYGVALGITQDNPKTVLAYSTVSQMGLTTAVLGMAIAAGDGPAVSAGAYYAMHHELAKGVAFLAVGMAAAGGGRPVLFVTGLVALGFAGLPFSGGAVAKLAIKPALGSGLTGTLGTVASVGSALLVSHFLWRLAASAKPGAPTPPGMTLSWLALCAASLALPWILFVALGFGSLGEALAPSALWDGLWPVALGIVLYVALRRSGVALPRPPEGDLVVLGAPLTAGLRAAAAWMERVDGRMRQWPAATLSLLALVLALAALMASGMHP